MSEPATKKPAETTAPPLGIGRLQAHHDKPADAGMRALARELLVKTGPLVLVADGRRFLYRAGANAGQVERTDLGPVDPPGPDAPATPTPTAEIGAE